MLSVPIHPDLKAALNLVKGPRAGPVIAKMGSQGTSRQPAWAISWPNGLRPQGSDGIACCMG